MKIIFLDIDGVLNHSGTSEKLPWGAIGLDPMLVKRFNRLIYIHPDAKIVISSSWRYAMPFDELKEYLRSHGLNGEIIDHTSFSFSYRPRGLEIKNWIYDRFHLSQQVKKFRSFVIIDDDDSEMDSRDSKDLDLRSNLVKTSFKDGGLQISHIDIAINILDGKE